MSTDIDSIKRKLLIKYPTFGSVIANLEFQKSIDIATAGTDGKVLLYNPKFLGDLSEKQQIFIFAHEVCHVAFEHIFRSEGKDKRLWNIATDSVINALLIQDGLPMVEGGVNIPEAINYDAEEMYNKLLEEEKKKQEQQSQKGNQGQQDKHNNQEQENSQGSQGQQDGQNSQEQQEENDIGHDTHSLWDKAIEERKKEQQEQAENKKQEQKQTKKKEKTEETEGKEQEKRETEEKSKFTEQGERETFKQNKIERRKQLQELSRELANKASHEAGDGIQREGKRLSDIGIATPLIDWRKLLRQAIRYDEEYTRKNARMRNGYFRHRVEQLPMPEAEILLDTSGSVSEVLLKNFLRECKNILDNSKVKVGCFNTEFHGFTELRKPEDIDNMSFPIGGGTDFNAAVGAFSRKAPNKIIFTDGEADMPRETVRNVIWVVFGDEKINPKGGKVINITGEQLRRLYQSFIQDKDDRSR
ncbi:MAG: VWA-like domain-containing protein [Clostridia bacterium]|jgi:predicted metal-dependent peptidase|nr:VWA-like domain-containing protein [Clostridia bacterium]HJJ10057.1 VWA-like domain-containing protein [Clostridiaceae bacterium]